MSKEPHSHHTCFDRVIPNNLDPRAAAHEAAVSHYVTAVKAATKNTVKPDAPIHQHLESISKLGELHANHPVMIARMALIDNRKWEAGHKLTCRFLDGDKSQQAKVIANAKIWEKYADIHIEFGSNSSAEVRISFEADPGSWSAVGQDCLVTSYFAKNAPTMNFGWLRDDTDDKEYERVVVHEFGHALGCIHEHQAPTENLHWDAKAVYAEFSGPPNNWSKADIDSNILQKYSPEGISASRFDRKSIMLYQFDASLFTDHKATPLNYQLSKEDKTMIGQMYNSGKAVKQSA
jgi:hypothetical protein